VKLYAMAPGGVSAVVLDCDDTLYTNARYRAHCAEVELEAISTRLEWPKWDAHNRLESAGGELSARLGRSARKSEIVLSLGLSLQWWNETRARICEPERFLARNPRLSFALDQMRSCGLTFAVASNSPTLSTRRVLSALGVDPRIVKETLIEGPDTTGVTKPDPVFFRCVARQLGVDPAKCLSIGNDDQSDAIPAIAAGMGAIILEAGDELPEIIGDVCRERLQKPLDLNRFALSRIEPGQIRVIALSGRAGAGKTRLAEHLKRVLHRHAVPTVILSLDYFLRQSTRERQAWLEEGRVQGREEYARRCDQMEWWDLERMQIAMDAIRRGDCVQLEGVYDRNDGGELSGTQRIQNLLRPAGKARGGACIVEGVAVAHLKRPGDHLVYVSSHPSVRRERLLCRDVHRDAGAAAERFRITQAFEDAYFPRFSARVDTVIDCTGSSPCELAAVPLM
jgi:FMN phosphatase YigB (HAD superfamily)/uridine kinase